MGDMSDGSKAEARGENEGCDHDTSSNRDRQSRRDRATDGDEPISPGDEDRFRGDLNQQRNPTTGGMLRQLIKDDEEQLAEIDEEIDRLRGAITRLEQRRDRSESRRAFHVEVLNDIEQRTEEDPSQENP